VVHTAAAAATGNAVKIAVQEEKNTPHVHAARLDAGSDFH